MRYAIPNWFHVRRTESVRYSGQRCCYSMAGNPTQSLKRISNSFLTTSNSSERVWLIVLNYVLPPETSSVWGHAFSRICADGGANRVFNFFQEEEQPSQTTSQTSGAAEEVAKPSVVLGVAKPSVILGDLDSITPAVREHYTRLGVPCLDMSHDQDSTDLDKCLAHVRELQAEERQKGGVAANQEDLVVVLGALGGRLDHTLGNLNSLYTHADQNIVLLGEGNVVRLLQAGTTHVHVSKEMEGLHCGIIPLRDTVCVSSKGLKWDMDEMELKFGGMISACNHVDQEDIVISCSGPCLWITTTKEHG